MSSVNAQIDAAIPLMKARAAEFDAIREMGPSETFGALTDRAIANLSRVFHGDGGTTEVIDAMVLCALALSVQQSEEEARDE